MSQTELKYFTPKEAQKTLPLVKQIVRDILNCGEEMRGLIVSHGGLPDENPELKKLFLKINEFVKELEEIGCHYKDWNFSVGLVDFPSVINGEEVMLCWKSDEPDISFYHSTDEGFAGRKKIPDVLLN